MDGTFSYSPKPFNQLYIIHSTLQNQSFPIFYCFLEGKTENNYYVLFQIIIQILHNYNIVLNPNEIQIDFEYACFNAIKRTWPSVIVSGCYFHFGQAIFRKIINLGLKQEYNTNITLKILFNQLTLSR